MSIAYAEFYQRISQVISDTRTMVNEGNLPCSSEVLSELESARKLLYGEDPLRIVLIGEFSAGKSSLISALTGESLFIHADVATSSTAEYSWNGLVLVDTPGVQAEDTDTDHDLIAKQATRGADLVLFIISNELFNQRLADHFHYIIGKDGLGLSQKTALIVNKMDRETNPDEELLDDITKVLGDYQEIPVYFCSASKYRQAFHEESPMKERFEKQSRFAELMKGINTFVDDAGTNGRLNTPISTVEKCLDMILSAASKTVEQKSRLEFIRRQKRVLLKLQGRFGEIKKVWKQQAYSTIIAQANDAAKQVSELSQPEDLEALFVAGLEKADGELISLYDGLETALHEAFRQASADLNEIGDSPLGAQCATLEKERGGRVSVNVPDSRPSGLNFPEKLKKPIINALQEGLSSASKNAKGLRDVYYKVGKALGKKFRPWEAVKAGEKIAKYAGKLGKAVPLIAVALDFYTQYKEERIKEEKERYLLNLRGALRGAFADQARVEAEVIEKVAMEVSRGPVQTALNTLEAEEKQIGSESKLNELLSEKNSEIRKACTALRDEIYGGQA